MRWWCCSSSGGAAAAVTAVVALLACLGPAGIDAAATAQPTDDTKKPANKDKKPPPAPCTVQSPLSGAFFDLNPLALARPDPAKLKSGNKKPGKDQRVESWHARGYDYPTNFTLNICAPVVEELRDVEGVPQAQWRNVSAFYRLHGKTYSLG